MNLKSLRYEKYAVAPSPSRDYYGLKVHDDQVILYKWKITRGPDSSPVIRTTKFSEFFQEKSIKDDILYAFGQNVLSYIEDLTSRGEAVPSLLTLPDEALKNLTDYLSLNDVANLSRVSRTCNELFSSNIVWEKLFKRLTGKRKLLEMERELGNNGQSGFKKLAKNHRILGRKDAIKKQTLEKSSTINQSDDNLKPPKKQQKNLPIGEKLIGDRLRKIVVNEGHHPLIVNKGQQRSLTINKGAKEKTNEEENSFLVQKNFLKSFIANLEDNDEDNDNLIKDKALKIKSPRSIFTKRGTINVGICDGDDNDNFESTATRSKLPERKKTKAKRPKEKIVDLNGLPIGMDEKTMTANRRYPVVENLDEDDDGTGMSFLMRRYLEATDGIEKKFKDCNKLAQQQRSCSTRDFGAQVDMSMKKTTTTASRTKKSSFKSVTTDTIENNNNVQSNFRNRNVLTKKSLKKY